MHWLPYFRGVKIIEQALQFIIGPLEWIMLTLVVGGGLYLLIHSRGYALRNIGLASRLLFQKEKEKGISRFEALSAVMASTVGLGNISGVAIAIYMGGPGVLVWMWITAILGATIKFYSCSLAVLFREKEADGTPLGGPMYTLRKGLPRWGQPLAVLFATAGLFGVLPAFTANQLTQTVITVVQPQQWVQQPVWVWKAGLGVLFTLLSAWVILGGLKKIVQVTAKMVPVMVVLYFLLGSYILVVNYNAIVPTFQMIFNDAFTLQAASTGGFWGLLLLGIRRAIFSNESGVGTAPMYHGQSQTKAPLNEGLVASLGPLLDTILVCTITGLIILISGVEAQGEVNGIVLTLAAFERLFFGWGNELLLLMVLVFGISSLLSYAYYGVKCMRFLRPHTRGELYNYIYLASIVFSAITTVDLVIGLIDVSFALMCIPNMLGILYLSQHIRQQIINASPKK